MVPAGQINTLDPNALAGLKRLAKDNSPEALAGAAKQFEAMFLQMVLKAMREATPSDSMMDSDQTRSYQSMLDQQMATNLAGAGGAGLARALVRQLGGGEEALAALAAVPGRQEIGLAFEQAALAGGAAKAAVSPARMETLAVPQMPAASAAGSVGSASAGAVPASAREFVERVKDDAAAASAVTGIPTEFMIAQAALETGWGKGELRRADGSPSYNLFNIKAGSSWKGETVEISATEYANGRAYTEKSSFRAYGSYAEAFADYARLLTGSTRYAEVVGQTDAAAFARGLQKAGYATDPAYAEKLTRIIGGNTLQTALAD